MALTFYTYPRCSTCRNAKKWFSDNNIEVDEVHLIETPPSATQIKELHEVSDVDIKNFFNTRGKRYRELGLKDRLEAMSLDEKYALLASDGMLIRRPIATDGTNVTIGFKEDTYAQTWLP